MPNHINITLSEPLDQGKDKPAMASLRLRKPNTGDVLDLIKLFGADVANAALSGADTDLKAELKGDVAAKMMAAVLQPEKLDDLAIILGRLSGLSLEQFRDLSVEDLTALMKGLGGFFPGAQTALSAMLQDKPPTSA